MPRMSQILRECEIGMLSAGISTRAVARELNVYFSTISHFQCCFRGFGSTSKSALDHVYDVVWVNGLPHGGGGIMVWAGINNGQRTELRLSMGIFKCTKTL